MPDTLPKRPKNCLGVVIVTFNSSDVILSCLETLLASSDVALRIAVVDNASQDGTQDLIRNWAAGSGSADLTDLPFDAAPVQKPVALLDDLSGAPGAHQHMLTLLEAPVNLGFAGGVNLGLKVLAALPELDRFWVLNPDSVVPPQTAAAFARHPVPETGFSLMGGRVLYLDNPGMIQIDGGTIARRTGITGNLGLYAAHAETPPADPAAMDFITGASMVASRAFYEQAGPLREDYFLYYEEVDWAMRRGDLPLAYCPQGLVYHHGGSAIGSATHNRPASPFALYFKHRARMMFLRRFFPGSILGAHAWSLAKAAQFTLKGFRSEAAALLAGAFGRPPPASVRDRLSTAALDNIFGTPSQQIKETGHAR